MTLNETHEKTSNFSLRFSWNFAILNFLTAISKTYAEIVFYIKDFDNNIQIEWLHWEDMWSIDPQ